MHMPIRPRDYRVLLVNPAGWQKESINLGLACLAGALKSSGFPVLILDLNRYPLDDKVLLQRTRRFAPSLVGVSVKTATALEGARVARLLSDEVPAARVLAGGPHVTLAAESYVRDNPAVDYALMGEAEHSIVRLARALELDEDVRTVPGLVFRRDGAVVVNAWQPPDDLDSLALPDLDAIDGFDWAGFRYPIVTSRGCPFECIYCCVNKLTGSRLWRARSAANVVDELETVAGDKGVTAFEIWDDNFTLNLPRAKEICRLILSRGLKLSWYCHNGIRADRVDAELAGLMARAGCTSVAFGVESGHPETFASINKGEPLSAVVKAVKTVTKAGIKAVGYFLIGLPGDTLQKFVESVRFQRSLPLSHYVFGMLIPYPKTPVWDIVATRGRMLCDIMETQHFSDAIVPVSFELPEFPKKDMVRAYYITKYFELFDALDGRPGPTPTVLYIATPEMIQHLPGMFIASPPGTRHVVAGDSVEPALKSLPAFSQVDADADITFIPAPGRVTRRDGQRLVIVGERRFMVRHLLLTNADALLFDPSRPLQVLSRAKRSVRPLPLLPEHLSALGAFAVALPGLVHQFGVRKVGSAAKVRLSSRLDALARALPAPNLPKPAAVAAARVAALPNVLRASSPLKSAAVARVATLPALVLTQSRQTDLKTRERAKAVIRPVARVALKMMRVAALPALVLAQSRHAARKARERAKTVLRPLAHAALKMTSAAAYLRSKAGLYLSRPEKKRFPYDDYPSHM